MTVAALNALSDPDAREALTACCGAGPWVDGMLAARPWHDHETLLAAADRCWTALSPADVAHAVEHHPRLGESRARADLSARASEWSSGEQSGATAADEPARSALAAGNAEYEARFGHTFILCASGRSAADMLAALRARLANDAATELRTTAAELHKITRLRLAKLLADD